MQCSFIHLNHFDMDEGGVQTYLSEAGVQTYLPSNSTSSESWIVLGQKLPKAEIVFFSQTIILYLIILTSVINLSIGNESEMWLILLSTSLGAILPNPTLKMSKKPNRIIEKIDN